MDQHKQKLLDALKRTITKVQGSLSIEKTKLNELIHKPLHEIRSLLPEDQMVYAELKYHAENRIQEVDQLHASPFFVKCEIEILRTKEKKILYFSKHHFSEEQIYSWIAPIARIRFEKPGLVEYKLPGEIIEKAILTNKEQYLIVDGKVVFFAVEDQQNPRELIYQEHFSAKKEGFVLPEIVAVMEKAQDAVIRAHHVGPFVISGPAGSGKTTLALHRVAFLVQAPDTAHLYPGESILVFVQDNGTKEYFSHLLPELGIKNVRITTFFEWASEILNIKDALYIQRRGDDEHDKNIKEFERLNQLSSQQIPTWTETKKFLQKHSKTGLDRIDLTIALMSFYHHNERLEIKTKYNAVIKGEIKEKTRTIVQNYSLIVIDEFQNYMPDQLKLLNTCVDQATKSVIYVGDIAQQVVSGAITSWNSIGLQIDTEREVRLHKVYRNTKQILTYIQGLGYKVEIPKEIRMGKDVREFISDSEQTTKEYIEKIIHDGEGTIGIIGKDENDIRYLQESFKDEKRVHVTTMALSQGVEFDTVCIVGIHKDFLLMENLEAFSSAYVEEKRKIKKDLLYVALTRAISGLHVVGSSKLSSLPINQTN